MFPVQTSVVRRGQLPGYQPGMNGWYGLADSASDQAAVEKANKKLATDVKKVAMAAAAASIGLQIGLMFAGPIGWAASAVISLVQYFTGKRYEKMTKDEIANASVAIKDYAEKARGDVQVASDKAYQEELPAGQALAVSGQPLEGLDNWLTDGLKKVRHAATVTVKKVMPVVAKVYVTPYRVVGKVGTKAVGSAAGAVGLTGVKKSLYSAAKTIDNVGAKAEGIIADPESGVNLLTGRATYLEAKEKAKELKAKAFAMIDHEKDSAIAAMTAPAYRQKVRIEIAKSLRGSTNLDELRALSAQAAAQQADQQRQLELARQAVASMVPDPSIPPVAVPSNQPALLLGGGVAAALAAALFFK